MPFEQEPVKISYATGQAAKSGFGLHWWAWISFPAAIVVVFVLDAVIFPSHGLRWAIEESVEAAFGLLVMGLIPAWVGFYIFRRSRLAASIILVVILGLAILGQLESIRTQIQARQKGIRNKVMAPPLIQVIEGDIYHG